MAEPLKNRLHDYEAGWLTLLLKMGVAGQKDLQDAQNRVAQACGPWWSLDGPNPPPRAGPRLSRAGARFSGGLAGLRASRTGSDPDSASGPDAGRSARGTRWPTRPEPSRPPSRPCV